MEKNIEISQIIVRTLEGVETESDKTKLNLWLAESNENRLFFQELKDVNKRDEALRLMHSFDMEKVRYQIFQRYSQKDRPRVNSIQILSYAATVALLIGIGWFLMHIVMQDVETPKIVDAIDVSIPAGKPGAVLTLSSGEKIFLDDIMHDSIISADPNGSGIFVSKGQISHLKDPVNMENFDEADSRLEEMINTIEVPLRSEYRVILGDGTVVYLNAQSKLEYPTKFASNERRVKVSGEAFFEVTHNPNLPFVVQDDRGNHVEVKGTSFNIRNYPNESDVRVALEEGKVTFVSWAEERRDINPGEELKLHTTTQTIEVEQVDVSEVTAWKDGRFIFHNKTLDEIFSRVSRWYGVDVIYHDPAARYIRFSADIQKYSDLKDLLEIFELTESVKFEFSNNQIVVSKKNRKKP